jgi:hypothetical protein
MKILRQGSRRSSSSLEIVPNKTPQISWDKKSQSVTLNVRSIPDGHDSKYDYWVYLSISDLQETMGCLAEKGIGDCKDEISKGFSSHLDNLIKIILCSVGIVSQGNTNDGPKTIPTR